MKEKWPNFFIVGAPRSGTTSLYNYLKQTPGIYMSSVKEPGYFIPNDFRNYSKETYLELFKDVKAEKAIGEASAGYLENSKVPKLIHDIVPNAKIIINLRDPVFRTFSDYLNMIRVGNTNISFEDALKNYHDNNNTEPLRGIIKTSFYSKSVKRYYDIFDDSNIKILIFEESIKNSSKMIKDVLKFLDIDSEPPENISEVHNAYSEPLGKVGNSIVRNKILSKFGKKLIPKRSRESTLRKILNKKGERPILSENQKISLTKIFENDVKELEEFLDYSVPWLKI